jgi:hypothetical protein
MKGSDYDFRNCFHTEMFGQINLGGRGSGNKSFYLISVWPETKHSSLFVWRINGEEEKFYNITAILKWEVSLYH